MSVAKLYSKKVEIEFLFEDTGIGIPQDRLPFIFYLFTQAAIETTRKFGGTGLSIVKKLVSLMNGTIHVESKLDKETTFKLNIPFEIISEKKSLTNGEIVLEKLAKNSYDIILMDLQMPLMDGYQTTINIRNSDYDYIQHIPIIALTAHAIKGVLEKCIEIGVDDYVSKPIGFKELISKIKKVMD